MSTLIVFTGLFYSCNETEETFDAPSISIVSDQFDADFLYTGTNDETVSFLLSAEAPNQFVTLTVDLYLDEVLDQSLYSLTNEETFSISDEVISFDIKDEYVDGIVVIRISAIDTEGLSSALDLSLSATPRYEQGYFIVNEGAWGASNASISYFDNISSTLTNDFFFSNNDQDLGDQAQSMTRHNGFGYIVVQASKKIEVISLTDGTNTATIDTDAGIVSPRYFLGASDTKGYVSGWGADGVSGTVKVIDLATNSITKTIDNVGQGSNRMIIVGTNLLVANAGGWGSDNTVTVIDTTTDEIVSSITVGDNPNSIALDNAGNIWVASSGKTIYNADWSVDTENSTAPSISKLSSDLTAAFTIATENISYSADNIQLSEDGNNLLFSYAEGIYSLSTEATATSSIELFLETSLYGFSVNPNNGNIIVCQAPDFSSAGNMIRYTSAGVLIDEHVAGIGPNGAGF